MTRDKALQILKANQPLPSDPDLTENLVRDFDEARRYFLANPDPEAIPLFLNSFGAGSGFGIYQLVEDVVAKFPLSVVLPHLLGALRSETPSIRYWAAQIAARFPDASLVPALARLLDEHELDMRFAAVTALEQIEGRNATAVLRVAQMSEVDSELRSVLQEILSDRE